MNWLTSRCAPVAAFAALALASCDTGTALNVDLPDTASINTQYQDFDVSAGTVRLVPVQTQKTDHFLVGRLVDNVAGTTTARAFLNVVDSSIPDSLPSKFANPQLDSVVLVMGFDRVYGSATTPARFDVFKLATPLDERQVYSGNSSETGLTVLAQNLTSRLDRTQVQIVKPAQAATPTSAAVPAVTTIVPDPSVRLLLQRRSSTGQTAVPLQFATDLFAQLRLPNFGQPQLAAALKGLALAPSASHSSSIVSCGRPYGSRIVMYFRGNAARTDTLKRSYSIYFGPAFSAAGLSPSTDPRYYTQITNDLSPALATLSNRTGFVPSAALSGSSYVQEGTGLGTRITFNGLTDLIKNATSGGLTVNRAEIRIPVKPFTNALFVNPAQLYAVEVDGSNVPLQRVINFLPTDRIVQSDGKDQLGSGSVAYGTLNDALTTQPYYSIPVTSYLQAYLTDKLSGNPAALVLQPDSSVPVLLTDGSLTLNLYNTLTLNRAVLDAANIKLRVYSSRR